MLPDRGSPLDGGSTYDPTGNSGGGTGGYYGVQRDPRGMLVGGGRVGTAGIGGPKGPGGIVVGDREVAAGELRYMTAGAGVVASEDKAEGGIPRWMLYAGAAVVVLLLVKG